jgi:hypothetical protein
MKRIVSVLLGTFLLAGFLVGCGVPEEEEKVYNPPVVKQDPAAVEIDGVQYRKIVVDGTECIVSNNEDNFDTTVTCDWDVAAPAPTPTDTFSTDGY